MNGQNRLQMSIDEWDEQVADEYDEWDENVADEYR